jgi:hypothetical protein
MPALSRIKAEQDQGAFGNTTLTNADPTDNPRFHLFNIARLWSGAERAPAIGSDLVERDADPFFLAPDDMAGEARAIGDQGEALRDPDRAGDVEGCSRSRSIADHAIDRAAVELDRSGTRLRCEVRLSSMTPEIVQISRESNGIFRGQHLPPTKAARPRSPRRSPRRAIPVARLIRPAKLL